MLSVHRFTSKDVVEFSHLPALEVKHFPFNVVLFSLKSTAAIHFAQVHLNKRNLEEGRQTTAQIDRRSRHEVNIWNSFSATAY